MKQKKILYGVCGIGSGHTQRQLPLIEHFATKHQIIIFAYGESLRFFSAHYKDNADILVVEVSVPFYVGSPDGIDYEATKALPENQKNHDAVNDIAKQQVVDLFGVPDLVITDYEPISAEVAYTYDVPLITIDQQSKYLCGDFPLELNGCTYVDEVERLKLFFPYAAARIACSFFVVQPKKDATDVQIFPPVLKDSIKEHKGRRRNKTDILVYISAQQAFAQDAAEIDSILAKFDTHTFHVFVPSAPEESDTSTVTFYSHGDTKFLPLLGSCAGIVTTAGHTLLSEAMYLGVPVYALPLAVYEQQMNAKMISDAQFGVQSETINEDMLSIFLSELLTYNENITNDTSVLLRRDGKEQMIQFIEEKYL